MAEVVVGCLRLKDKKAVRGGKRGKKKREAERWCKKIFGRLRVCYWWNTSKLSYFGHYCVLHTDLIIHSNPSFWVKFSALALASPSLPLTKHVHNTHFAIISLCGIPF